MYIERREIMGNVVITLKDVETYLKVFWKAYNGPPSMVKDPRYKTLHNKLMKLTKKSEEICLNLATILFGTNEK